MEKNFLTSQKRDADRLKRGGGRKFFSIDQEDGEILKAVPAAPRSPEDEFDLDWIRRQAPQARLILVRTVLLSISLMASPLVLTASRSRLAR